MTFPPTLEEDLNVVQKPAEYGSACMVVAGLAQTIATHDGI